MLLFLISHNVPNINQLPKCSQENIKWDQIASMCPKLSPHVQYVHIAFKHQSIDKQHKLNQKNKKHETSVSKNTAKIVCKSKHGPNMCLKMPNILTEMPTYQVLNYSNWYQIDVRSMPTCCYSRWNLCPATVTTTPNPVIIIIVKRNKTVCSFKHVKVRCTRFWLSGWRIRRLLASNLDTVPRKQAVYRPLKAMKRGNNFSDCRSEHRLEK